MKKLLYSVLMLMSLAIIFGAGWASGAKVTASVSEPAAVRIAVAENECPNGDCDKEPEGGDCDGECPEKNDGEIPKHRHGKKRPPRGAFGLRYKLPAPPVLRDIILRDIVND